MKRKLVEFLKTFMLVFSLLLVSTYVQGSTSLIRTFVNGTGETATDLHIEYTNNVTSSSIIYIERTETSVNRRRLTITGQQGSTLDVDLQALHQQYPRYVANEIQVGASITIEVQTNQDEMGIERWWWTSSGERIGSINGANIRGDENPRERREAPNREIYSIINKAHHWGGTDRNRANGDPIEITMNISGFLDGLDPDEEEEADRIEQIRNNVELAIKQWSDCTSLLNSGNVPLAGEGNNPINHGLGFDPPVMAPGPSHRGRAAGQKFRSLTKDECNGILTKYPNGLNINIVDDEDEAADITTRWGGTPGSALGYGPSQPDRADPHRTIRGEVRMRERRIGSSRDWHFGEDTDGDGYITNMDTDEVPERRHDFYSIFKHELGHVLCFNHAGGNRFNDEPDFSSAEPLEEPIQSTYNEPDAFPFIWDDSDYPEDYSYIYFSSDRPGGFGGYDIWEMKENENEIWIVENLGPAVNSSFDERDPFLASDGTTLLFVSNKNSENGRFDIYRSILQLISPPTWAEAELLDTIINTDANETHPFLTADMKSLYFSSDREDGYGGWDIYSAELVWDGGFSFPYNLGSQINSPANEKDPSISALADLIIFSSDRTNGFGGYDIWFSNLDAGWKAPLNAGEAINSESDEISPAIVSNNRLVLFSSDRIMDSEGFNVYVSSIDKPEKNTPKTGIFDCD